jgi:PST family polysaccharide transporter
VDAAEDGGRTKAGASDVLSASEALKPPPTGRQAAWNYLVFGLSKSSTLIMTVVLARLLAPADFGLFALALLIVNLFDYVKDLGVGAALVQSPRNWNRLAPTGLTLSVMFGLLAGAVLAGTAGVIATALDHSDLTPLIRVLAIGLMISALSAIPAARLRRDLDFRRRIVPEFLGAAVKSVLTIVLAVEGLGVWSLVYGQLAAVVVTTISYWTVARTAVRFGFDRDEASALIRFGIPVSAVTVLAFAIYNVDYLAIGSRLGDYQLGLYTLAYRIPELVVLNLCIVISEVLFSSLSRLQHDRRALVEHFLQVLAVVVALTAPISVALAATAPALIGTLYGPTYAGAAGVLAVLSLFTLTYSASFHSGDVYKAIGRPSILTAINVGKLGVMIGPIWWAAGHSIFMVALVLLATELAHFVVRMLVVRTVAGVALPDLLKAVLRPMPAAACMGAVMVCVGHVAASLPAPVILVVTVSVGLPTYVVVLRLTAPELVRAGLAVVRSVRSRSEGESTTGTRAVTPSAGERRAGSVPDSERGIAVSRNLLTRTWLVMTVLATIGLSIGVLVAYVFNGHAERFTAQATLAMLPGPEVPVEQAPNFWEVLNQGQATRSAAIVLGDNRWLDAAASAAGVSKSDLTLSAGAIPSTTLITVRMQADSARGAELALDSVLTDASGFAASVSGPFRLETIASPDGSAHSMGPARVQMFGALGIAGLLVGAGAGLLVSRSAQGRSARRRVAENRRVAEKGKRGRIAPPVANSNRVGMSNTEPPTVETPLR